jgi:hypothetical protein
VRSEVIILILRDKQLRVNLGATGVNPLADESVDAAVVSLVLCPAPDQHTALLERRVLHPDAELRFSEHVIPRCQPKRLWLQPLITAAVAEHRRRLPSRPRHRRGDRARRLHDHEQRAAHVRRGPLRAQDPAHPRDRPPRDLTAAGR